MVFMGKTNMDSRAEFANNVLQLLYDKYDGDIENTNFLEELKSLYNQFEEYVRNIYETITDDIPLFLYHDYLEARGPDDIYCERFEDMSLTDIIESVKVECHDFYGEDEE